MSFADDLRPLHILYNFMQLLNIWFGDITQIAHVLCTVHVSLQHLKLYSIDFEFLKVAFKLK